MRLLLLVSLLIAVSGCTLRRFHDVDLRPGAAAGELQKLAQAAQRGDKPAQLALGRRYEAGDGVVRNLLFAERLYEAAASATSGTIMIYQPPIAPQRYGTVMPVRVGPDSPGLPEAVERLRALRAALGRGG